METALDVASLILTIVVALSISIVTVVIVRDVLARHRRDDVLGRNRIRHELDDDPTRIDDPPVGR